MLSILIIYKNGALGVHLINIINYCYLKINLIVKTLVTQTVTHKQKSI